MAYFYEFEQVNEGKDAKLLSEFWNSLNMDITDIKLHTIRGGERFKDGDWFSPRVWSGKPRHSPQILLCGDIKIPWVQPVELPQQDIDTLAHNDGLTADKFRDWFKHPEPFHGQIICWVESLQRYTL
jgi:hypothetical protein